MTAERVRVILWLKIERKKAIKSNKKETSGKGRKEPVKIVVKPVYVGKQEMTEVFGSVALDNIRRKMQGS
jgi:hypothetical protein